jgi:phosphoglycolate phosphatase-like HAD superfamily hydrolase
MQKLILWDIDGTLLYSGGVAGEAMRAAMELVYGRSSTEARHSYAGKTDRQIIIETFAERAHDDLMGTIEHFTATYIEELSRRRDDFLARCQVLDGVPAALERLAAADVVQSVLTGNLQPIARIKLDLMGLSRFLDLDAGAYGSDHHLRNELVPVAAARAARRYGRSFSGPEIIVIGDTPNDIDFGRAGGARTIAVATGPISADALRAHGADVVLPNLSDTDLVLQSIFGEGSAV